MALACGSISSEISWTVHYYSELSTIFTVRSTTVLEGPATHLSLVFIACRRYETKHDFAGPPRTRCGY
jgi:hypothetical protein